MNALGPILIFEVNSYEIYSTLKVLVFLIGIDKSIDAIISITDM